MQSIFNNDENTEPEREETAAVGEPSVIPETIQPLNVSEEIKEAKQERRSWKQWFETENAVRTIYLVFGFFCDCAFDGAFAVFDAGDLLR
jgi:hypothetical protein